MMFSFRMLCILRVYVDQLQKMILVGYYLCIDVLEYIFAAYIENPNEFSRSWV